MTRQTSMESYNALVLREVLSPMRRKVYSEIWHHGPVTQQETERKFGDVSSTFGPRFAELQRMGLIREVGQRKSERTGHSCILWDVTDATAPVAGWNSRPSSGKRLAQAVKFVRDLEVYFKGRDYVGFLDCERLRSACATLLADLDEKQVDPAPDRITMNPEMETA